MPTYTRKEGDVTVTYTKEEYEAKKETENENNLIGCFIFFVGVAIAAFLFSVFLG
jgi:hypothetical protein